MKKHILRVVSCLSLAATLLSTGCGIASRPSPAEAEPPPKAPTLEERANELVSSMTLTEKIGQMTMIGIHGTAPTEDSLYMLHQFHVGGIILFDRNMESQEQVKGLVGSLQAQSEEKLPLFIAIDEEGGQVARMKEALPPPPSQEAIGATGDPELAAEHAKEISASLQGMGINVNFAPVADVGAGRERSYSTDPATAAEFVAAACTAYEEAGMLPTLKHFPGIGRATADPHKKLSDIPISLEELEASDLLPFRVVIDAMPHDRFLVMASHLRFPALDAERPASLSGPVITGLLRDRMGFQGVVVTDDLQMGAATDAAASREMGVLAVQAGADIMLVCHEYATAQEVYLGVLDAVKNGTISEERIDESVRRIVKAKLSLPGTTKAGKK